MVKEEPYRSNSTIAFIVNIKKLEKGYSLKTRYVIQHSTGTTALYQAFSSREKAWFREASFGVAAPRKLP